MTKSAYASGGALLNSLSSENVTYPSNWTWKKEKQENSTLDIKETPHSYAYTVAASIIDTTNPVSIAIMNLIEEVRAGNIPNVEINSLDFNEVDPDQNFWLRANAPNM